MGLRLASSACPARRRGSTVRVSLSCPVPAAMAGLSCLAEPELSLLMLAGPVLGRDAHIPVGMSLRVGMLVPERLWLCWAERPCRRPCMAAALSADSMESSDGRCERPSAPGCVAGCCWLWDTWSKFLVPGCQAGREKVSGSLDTDDGSDWLVGRKEKVLLSRSVPGVRGLLGCSDWRNWPACMLNELGRLCMKSPEGTIRTLELLFAAGWKVGCAWLLLSVWMRFWLPPEEGSCMSCKAAASGKFHALVHSARAKLAGKVSVTLAGRTWKVLRLLGLGLVLSVPCPSRMAGLPRCGWSL
mmetsp:Transcript_40122/g.98599  ORF Transcript_40122/g.98599 Transcript_40122/m.98599 type:complete len:300 (-) Transcript_40122:24-923(-)